MRWLFLLLASTNWALPLSMMAGHEEGMIEKENDGAETPWNPTSEVPGLYSWKDTNPLPPGFTNDDANAIQCLLSKFPSAIGTRETPEGCSAGWITMQNQPPAGSPPGGAAFPNLLPPGVVAVPHHGITGELGNPEIWMSGHLHCMLFYKVAEHKVVAAFRHQESNEDAQWATKKYAVEGNKVVLCDGQSNAQSHLPDWIVKTGAAVNRAGRNMDPDYEDKAEKFYQHIVKPFMDKLITDGNHPRLVFAGYSLGGGLAQSTAMHPQVQCSGAISFAGNGPITMFNRGDKLVDGRKIVNIILGNSNLASANWDGTPAIGCHSRTTQVCFVVNNNLDHFSVIYSNTFGHQFSAMMRNDGRMPSSLPTPSTTSLLPLTKELKCIPGHMYNFMCGTCRSEEFRIGADLTAHERDALTALKANVCPKIRQNVLQGVRRVYQEVKNAGSDAVSWVAQRLG